MEPIIPPALAELEPDMTMVIDATPNKRRRVDQHSESPLAAATTKRPASRYPQSCLLSTLLYRQAPRHLASSAHSVVVTVPPKPNPPGIHAITGDHYSLDLSGKHAPLCKTQLRLAQELHARRTITHLEWNQRGTALATVDETGRIGIWELGSSAEEWTQIYTTDLCQPVAAFLWLNHDRRYEYSETDDRFVKENIQGPRNPYGVLSFIVVTVQGQLAVYYQRGGKIFSTFSTTLPAVGGSAYRRADTGCYGMMLMGIDDWKRISHASILLGKDGNVYLAAHYANAQSQTIHIYKITIRFTHGSREGGGVVCQEIAKLRMTPSLLKSAGLSVGSSRRVSQVHILQRKSKIVLAIGLSSSAEEKQFNSFLAKWSLEGQTDLSNSRASLHYTEGFSIDEAFITCLTSSRDGRLVVGLSNGSVHMEFRESNEFGLSKTTNDTNSSISYTFWQILTSSSYADGRPDAVVDIALSPNETHALCLYSSSKYGVARTTSDPKPNEADTEISLLEKMIKLSLLNQLEDADLLSELVRLEVATGNKGIAEDVINRAITAYQVFCSQGRVESLSVTPFQADIKAAVSVLREWNSPQRGYAYGLALGLLDRLPERSIQYTNFARAIQLPIILECFLGSCTSDYSTVTQVLEGTDKTETPLEFDPDSLWSLVSLTTWTLDFVRWILSKWFMLFNCKHPKNSALADITARPVHAVLLLHGPSRIALYKTLVIIKHFIQFTSSSSYELQRRPETAQLLRRYASNILQNEPVSIENVLSFLKAIDDMDTKNEEKAQGEGQDDIAKEWMLLLKSRLPKSELVQLRKITADFAETCAQPVIYLEQDKEQRIDVLRKRWIPPNAKHVRSCVRCHQLSLPPSVALDESDPSVHALWYQSLGRRCICGGLFT